MTIDGFVQGTLLTVTERTVPADWNAPNWAAPTPPHPAPAVVGLACSPAHAGSCTKSSCAVPDELRLLLYRAQVVDAVLDSADSKAHQRDHTEPSRGIELTEALHQEAMHTEAHANDA